MQERGTMSELVPEHSAIFDKHRKKVVRENSLPCGFKKNLDIFFQKCCLSQRQRLGQEETLTDTCNR